MKKALLFLGVMAWCFPGAAQIQESYFGLHQNKYTHGEPWPTVSLLDSPYGERSLTWDDLPPAPVGCDPNNHCYRWGRNSEDGDFDKVINDSAEHGVDVMFTVV